YNIKVCSRSIDNNDIVLKKAEVNDPGHTWGKLAPNWEGPYRVIHTIRDGTHMLAMMDGKTLPRIKPLKHSKKE
ncbi:hypothetical protein BHE74_00058201, partial [Ensete ventricosum]